jgi:ADP-ribose pyrophosphatase
MSEPKAEVTAIEVVEDFTSTGRCDEGFLQVRRLRCKNRRADGTSSAVYRVDVVDRPRLDAVAVLIYRHDGDRLSVLTRENLRPAAYFRKDKTPVVPDPEEYLRVEEIVAGLLETSDVGVEGVRHRAVEEVAEEAGYTVTADRIELLGAPFFVAPGILSEKIHLTAVNVTGLEAGQPSGDGSPLEEGGVIRWHDARELLGECEEGAVADAKTELALRRFLARAR